MAAALECMAGIPALGQDSTSTIKSLLQEWKGREIFLNDGSGGNLAEVYADYFEYRLGTLKYYIPYHAICKIENIVDGNVKGQLIPQIEGQGIPHPEVE